MKFTLLIAALLFGALSLQATERPTGKQVLVAYRSDYKDSKGIAQHYAERRNVPLDNMCAIAGLGQTTVDITRQDFEKKIQKRITACLEKSGKSKILYIVLAYGFPFQLSGLPASEGWSLDQYLALPFDSRAGSRISNPYFANNDARNNRYTAFQTLADFRTKNPETFLYSVWRLEGPTPKLANSLVDKAMATETGGAKGTACFDRRFGKIEDVPAFGSGIGDWRIFRAAEFAKHAGMRVLEDDQHEEFGTPPAPTRCSNALLYAGWYSYNNYNDAFDWADGAIGVHIDSASCTNPRTGKSWCANALGKGIALTSGAVAEPYLEGLPHPDGLMLNLLQGANAGDAFLRNTLWLRWMIINVGDPLYAPFANLPRRSELGKQSIRP